MSSGNLIIRQAPFDDFNKYIEIMHNCFNIDVTKEYFLWKYFNNPAGKAISFEAWEADLNRIAALYSIMPELYTINNREFVIYQSFDTMTHSDYRRMGLFVKLATVTYAELKKKSGSIRLLGIAGPLSFHGLLNNLNWISPKSISYIALQRQVFNIPRLIYGFSLNDYRIVPCKIFDQEHDILLSKILKQAKPIEKKLNSEILNWKIFQNPIKKYDVINLYQSGTLRGFCISETKNKRTFIDYVITDFGTDINNIMVFFMKYLFEHHNSQWIYTWEPTNLTLKSRYAKIGFLKNSFSKGPFSYKIPVIFQFEPMYINQINMHDIENYNLNPIFQD